MRDRTDLERTEDNILPMFAECEQCGNPHRYKVYRTLRSRNGSPADILWFCCDKCASDYLSNFAS